MVCVWDVAMDNEEVGQAGLGSEAGWVVHAGSGGPGAYRALAEKVLGAYPNLKLLAITLRESKSASHNGWSACLHNRDEFLLSRTYEITHLVDRVGGG